MPSAVISEYCAVVVGGGPAGLTVVGNLMDNNLQRILWVDPSFDGGRVNAKYRNVPSNTKVGLFADFATVIAPFREIVESTPEPNAFTELKKLDQNKGCKLSYGADICQMLTEGLSASEKVHLCRGKVSSSSYDSKTNSWSVQVQPPSLGATPITVTAPRLVLCTGSTPSTVALPPASEELSHIHLDIALNPPVLSNTFLKNVPATVAVVGASHSAVLVLMNLCNLAQTSHPHLRVKWFTRSKLQYAEFMDGWILRDNTGLKGEAAVWARENLDDDVLASSPIASIVEKVWLGSAKSSPEQEAEIYTQELPSCTHIVQAVGFKRNPLPALTMEETGQRITPVYDPIDGGFTDNKGKKVQGLYGAGIAWPERVTDPHGNVEYAVGFWKFMRYIRKVSPEWAANAVKV